VNPLENHGLYVGGQLHNTGAIAAGEGASASVGRAAANPSPGPMMRIFVNYRSRDESGTALLLKRELSRRFGAENVFIDSGMIPPGSDFEHALLRQVRRADALLAVIGPRWLTAEHPAGGVALHRRDDWVRRELAEAFAAGVPVVPILVNEATRLTKEPLPDDIARLRTCEYLTLRHDSADSDLTKIINQLGRLA
jgi:hypothetical protein